MANDSINSTHDNQVPNGLPINGTTPEDLSHMSDFSIDEYRPMKVAVIGAGFGGILAGIRFRQHVPNLELAIYEKNPEVGGTWYSNRYPGLTCDVPSHCFCYTFEPKTDWSACYSGGPEILDYLRGVVDKYALRPFLHLQHELVHARWNDDTSKWHIRIRRPSSESETGFEEFEDTADVVFNSIGLLSRWQWPDIPGLHDFKGPLAHSADWNFGGKTWQEDVKDWGDKKVAVVGLGSSALQIVAALQPKVKTLYNCIRGRTWIAPPFAVQNFAAMLGRDLDITDASNLTLTDEEKKSLEDPAKFQALRHSLETQMNSHHQFTLRDSELQKMGKVLFTEHMQKGLEKKPGVAEKLIPDFSVSVKRVTPAPGYLEALCADNCDLINDAITKVTPTSLEFANGKTLDVDAIICATGFDLSWRLPFEIIGRNGVRLADKWSPYPQTYMSICTDGFPNMFFAGGPSSAIATAGLIIMIEEEVAYAVKATAKLQRERLKSIEVKPEAVADFESAMASYFKRTVFTEPVSTWYKVNTADGKVSALWPGSNLHHIRALKNPRWEDFEYERIDKANNRLFWLGDGMSYYERTFTGDRAWYIHPEHIDFPPVPRKQVGA